MKRHIILAATLALGLGGCTTLAQFTASTATSLSSSSPTQVATLADAINAADLVTKGAKIAVDTGKLDAGTMKEIDALSTAIHTALTDLETANAQHKSLTFAAFNAALNAYLSYTTNQGITH